MAGSHPNELHSIDTTVIGLAIPTINDVIQGVKKGIKKGGQIIDAAAQKAVDAFEKLSPLEQGILGVIPFGDAVDLFVQAHKQAKGKGADPVIVTLSAIGLAADLGTLTGVGVGFNASISAIKVAYKSMNAVGKAVMKNIFAEAAKDPKLMKRLVDSIVELAKDGALMQLTTEQQDQLPDILKIGLLKGSKAAAHAAKAATRKHSKSADVTDVKMSENNTSESLNMTSPTEENKDPMAKQQYEAIANVLQASGVSPLDPNWNNMVAQVAANALLGVNGVAKILENIPGILPEQAQSLANSTDKQLTMA